MPYIVEIRRNADGLIRRTTLDVDWWVEPDGNSAYWWGDGNMACDCNRELEFSRAAGEERPIDSVKCGMGAYSARCLALDGTVLYEDDDWTKA